MIQTKETTGPEELLDVAEYRSLNYKDEIHITKVDDGITGGTRSGFLLQPRLFIQLR